MKSQQKQWLVNMSIYVLRAKLKLNELSQAGAGGEEVHGQSSSNWRHYATADPKQT